jgi:hypothetical protein
VLAAEFKIVGNGKVRYFNICIANVASPSAVLHHLPINRRAISALPGIQSGSRQKLLSVVANESQEVDQREDIVLFDFVKFGCTCDTW